MPFLEFSSRFKHVTKHPGCVPNCFLRKQLAGFVQYFIYSRKNYHVRHSPNVNIKYTHTFCTSRDKLYMYYMYTHTYVYMYLYVYIYIYIHTYVMYVYIFLVLGAKSTSWALHLLLFVAPSWQLRWTWKQFAQSNPFQTTIESISGDSPLQFLAVLNSLLKA